MHTIQYQLPNIDMLLDRQSRPDYKVNPLHSELDNEFSAFLDKVQDVISPSQRKVSNIQVVSCIQSAENQANIGWKELEVSQMPLCVAAFSPDADMQQLRVSLDYSVLIVVLEIMSDVSNPQAVQFDLDFMVNLLNACSDNRPFDISKHKSSLIELTETLGRRCFPPLSLPYCHNATQGTISYLQTIAQEIHSRTNPSAFTLDSYLAHRRKSIAMYPVIVFNQWMAQINLSPDILKTPALEGLLESTLDLAALPNDLISYKKEKAKGEDICNLISVTMVDPAVPVEPGNIQAALDFAGSKISEAYSRFQKCKLDALAQLAPHDSETRSEILRFVNILLDMIDGNLVWHIDPRTLRYHVFETPKERAQWLVSICVGS